MSNHPETGARNEAALVDLRDMWFGFRRQAHPFFAVLALSVGAAGAYALLAEERYTAETSLIIEPKREVVSLEKDVMTELPSVDPVAVDTEVELLRSRAMALRVAARLARDENHLAAGATTGLAAAAPLRPSDIVASSAKATNSAAGAASPAAPITAVATSPNAATPVVSPRKAIADSDELVATQTTAAVNAVPQTAASASRVKTLLYDLRVSRVGATSLIKIYYTSSSPVEAAAVANAYAEEYISEQIESQYSALAHANQWIDRRLEELRGEVRRAEKLLADYRAKKSLVPSTEGDSSFTEQRIDALAKELATARTELSTLRSRYSQVSTLRGRGSVEAIGEAMASPVINELSRQRTELNKRVAELEVRYGERHPELMSARQAQEEVERQFQSELGRIVNSLRSDYEFGAARVAAIEGEIARAQGALASESGAVADIEELQRNVDAPKSVYEALLARKKELNERDSLSKAHARVVARAATPDRPTEPRRKLIVAAGLMLGLLAAAFVAFLLEALDKRVRNTRDIRREFGPGAPVVLVPRVKARRKHVFGKFSELESVADILERDYKSIFAESMREIRVHLSSVESTVEDRASISIAFTSTFAGANSTATAFAFAALLAKSGKRVAFLDCGPEATELPAGWRDSAPDLPKRREGHAPRSKKAHAALAAPSAFDKMVAGRAAGRGEKISRSALAFEPSDASIAAADDATPVEAGSTRLVPSEGLAPPPVVHEAPVAAFVEHEPRRHSASGSYGGVDFYRTSEADKLVGSGAEERGEVDTRVFENVLHDLSMRYDYVVLDTPAVMSFSESATIAGTADFV
ncbi:MAG: exopolysaccharide transport family protein, partial [Parvularculaceae bacterium]|nr:exopolysaccharide transport family protein [Parvularculaceae bacterium]